MTTIVYKDHALYADRVNIHAGIVGTRSENCKLNVSKDKQIAYGFCWIDCSDAIRDQFERQLRMVVEHYIANPEMYFEPVKITTVFGEEKLVHEKTVLFMTQTEAFSIAKMNGVIYRVTEIPTGIGSGGWLAVGKMEAGLEPAAAIAGIGWLDTQTGQKIDTVKASKLKPFIYKGVK